MVVIFAVDKTVFTPGWGEKKVEYFFLFSFNFSEQATAATAVACLRNFIMRPTDARSVLQVRNLIRRQWKGNSHD